MKYIIGLDLGINNVGWSVVNAETNEIKSYGVKKFSISNGASDRRNFRNSRRRLKRKDTRKEDILKILNSINFPNNLTIDTKLIETRCKGLNEKISKQDITNILTYMAVHRGYIPYGDEEVSFVDLKEKYPCEYYRDKFLNSINNKYRAQRETVTSKDNEKEIRKVLKTQQEYYPEITEDVIERIIQTLNRKRKFWEGPGGLNSLTNFGRFKTEEDVTKYKEQKDINPEYEKYIFEDLIGRCEVDPDEKCASTDNFYAEKFNLLNDFINVSFLNIDEINNKEDFYLTNNKTYKLKESGLNRVFKYCLDKENVTIKGLLKDLFATTVNNMYGYRQKDHDSNKPDMSTMNTYRSIKKIFAKNNANMEIFKLENIDKYNEIINYFMLVPGNVELINMISSMVMPLYENDKDALKETFKSKRKKLRYHALCEKVLKRACNDMLSLQKNYMQVYKLKDYGKKSREIFIERYEKQNKGKLILNSSFIDDIVASPQVKKTLRQAEKVINEIVKDMKSLPYAIAIESAKEELSGNDKRNMYISMNKKNKELHDKAEKTLKSLGYDINQITKKKITKIMLYEEFNGLCPYCNKSININYLINGSDEIEHILPRSDSFNDSLDNRTISCADCNSKKGNRTPLQYLNGSDKESFINRIKSNKNISELKKENFLFYGDLTKYKTRFFNRNLRDTAYATKELVRQINIFNNYLEFKNNGKKILTMSTPGQLTHDIRERYNLEKDRDAGERPFHHAVDASILALLPTTSIGKKIMKFQNDANFFIQDNSKKIMQDIGIELKYYNTKDDKIEYDDYIKDLKEISDTNPKFMYSPEVNKDPNKKLFNANLYKVIKKEDKYYKIEQINDIYDYKVDLNLLEKLFDDSKNETLLCQSQHKEFYNKLKKIYEIYKDSGISPFEAYQREINSLSKEDEFDYITHGIRMSENGPVVKKLRYYTPINEPYLVNKKTINKKDTTYLAYDSLAQAGIEVYYNIDKNCFVFVPIPCTCYNFKTGKVNKENNEYIKYYQKNIGTYNVQYKTTLYNGNTIEINKKDGSIIKGEVSYYHKTLDKIVLKSEQAFTKSDLGFSIIDYSPIGKCQKRLTFMIK